MPVTYQPDLVTRCTVLEEVPVLTDVVGPDKIVLHGLDVA